MFRLLPLPQGCCAIQMMCPLSLPLLLLPADIMLFTFLAYVYTDFLDFMTLPHCLLSCPFSVPILCVPLSLCFIVPQKEFTG